MKVREEILNLVKMYCPDVEEDTLEYVTENTIRLLLLYIECHVDVFTGLAVADNSKDEYKAISIKQLKKGLYEE